jgi:hypothetical protein
MATETTASPANSGDPAGSTNSSKADLPFPLTLLTGTGGGGSGSKRCGFFGGSWFGTLVRMCGILFIITTTALSNGEVLELEILNWIFFVVVSSFSVIFFLAYMGGFLKESRHFLGIFIRTIADFAILAAAVFCLVLLGSEAESTFSGAR